MVIEYNFSIPTGSYLSKRLRFLKSTGLPLGLMQHMVRMYIRETPNSPTILLALNTDNGGAVTCAQNVFYPGTQAAYLFYDRELNGRYTYRFKLPNGPWVFSPDGIIQLWAGAAQTAEAFGSLKEVFYDLEIVPLMKGYVKGCQVGLPSGSAQVQGFAQNLSHSFEMILGDGNTPGAATDQRVDFSNSSSNDKVGWIILPATHNGRLQYFEPDGIVQVLNKSSDRVDDVVPYADTVPRRVLGTATNYISVTPAWPTLPQLDEKTKISCKAIYTAPPIQIAANPRAAFGYERIANSNFTEDPEGGSNLVTNGTFGLDTTGWTIFAMNAGASVDTGKLKIQYNGTAYGYPGFVSMDQPISSLAASTLYKASLTISDITSGLTGSVKVGLRDAGGTAYYGSIESISAGTLTFMISTPVGVTPTTLVVNFPSFTGPTESLFKVDDITLYDAAANSFAGGVGWSYSLDNMCLSHAAEAGTNTLVSSPVLSAADAGKRFRIQILVGKVPAENETTTRMMAASGGTLKLAINGQTFTLGEGAYAWGIGGHSITFTVDADELDTTNKCSIVLEPENLFDGSIFCISMREIPSYGSLSIDADNGNDQCVLTATLKPFLLQQIQNSVPSRILQVGDVIFITDLRVDHGESSNATKVGLRRIVSVSDSVLVLEPKMSEGDSDDETGVTDLVITKVDPNLAEQFVRGKITLTGPNLTREAESWR